MKKFAVLAVLILSVNLFAKDVSWYKCFKGKIGDYPVTLHINKYGEQVTGYYNYDKYAQPLTVMGTSKGDSLILSVYFGNEDYENFSGKLFKGKYSGRWESDKNKSMNFELNEDTKISGMYEFVYVTGEKKLLKDYKNSPYASYLEGTIWPTDDNPRAEMLEKILITERHFPAGTTSPGERMLANKNEFFANYKKDNKDVTVAELKDLGYTSMYNLAIEDYLRIAYQDEKILVLSGFSYAYTGGAHGNYGTGFTTYDIKTGKKFSVGEVLTDEGVKEMPKLLEKNFRRQNNAPETQSLTEFGLLVDTIYANDNFALTPGCLMFSYTPYEIGPYAAGEINIYIPINEVEKYLKPKALQLIKQD
jgi:hypothetical protein